VVGAGGAVMFGLVSGFGAKLPKAGDFTNGEVGEGFRMPARGDYPRALGGPASESLPGRNPRGAGQAV
jgi:hypothetical protein